MKTVAIICEYNPFHSGHKHQIDTVRAEFGADTRIIAIMSGNYTQRASLAFAPKVARARWAVECGVNLVLELPFPYSMASAEFFARCGVEIANALGIVDYLSFGSECADLSVLCEIARNLAGREYSKKLSELLNDEEYASLGYPKVAAIAYSELFGNPPAEISAPNNILALEYLKSLARINSRIKPHTVLRRGASYNETELSSREEHQSAGAIRAALFSGNFDALKSMPEFVAKDIGQGIEAKAFPPNEDTLFPAIASHFLLNNASAPSIMDADGGLYNRLVAMCREATDISSLYELSQTKKYTSARIRRAVWFSFFGVTSSDVKTQPLFTQLLAADEIGTQALREIKKINGIKVITKPTNLGELSVDAKRMKALSDRADMIYQLALPNVAAPADALRFTPYIKK